MIFFTFISMSFREKNAWITFFTVLIFSSDGYTLSDTVALGAPEQQLRPDRPPAAADVGYLQCR